MDGREFLQSARDLLAVPCERNWRSAAGRAYYALLHEGQTTLQRWGFPKLAQENLHVFVRRRFVFTPHPDLQAVGRALDRLSHLRNQGDYQLSTSGPFAGAPDATNAVAMAASMVALLDAINADPVRSAAVVAALRTAWP
jgi:hypothetical protein